MTREVRFIDLPAVFFPMVWEIIDPDTHEVLWTAQLDEPGAIETPGLLSFGRRVQWRVHFADGPVKLGKVYDPND